jgi:molybdopterin-guanine dinucleotide biosynthesis protein A
MESVQVMKITGVILAGGMSRRLGQNKVILPIDGEPMINRVHRRVSKIADHTIVIVNNLKRVDEIELPEQVKIITDIHPNTATLGGIFTGLSKSDTEWNIVVACDMPFLNVRLFKKMLALRHEYDAVIPITNGYPEPTHALYSKACLPAIERKLLEKDFKISKFLDEVRVNFLTENQIAQIDPETLSFFNVNTQDDLSKAVSLIDQGY